MFFKKKSKFNKEDLGLNPDPRSLEDQEKDWLFEEVYSFPQVKWEEKEKWQWPQYPIFNQDGSSSCAAQTVAKILGIENVLEEGKFVQFSARDIYTRRKNAPGKGMYFKDAMEIGYKHGASLEQLMPSQDINETEMNKSQDRASVDKQMALVTKAGNYFKVPTTIDKIASIIGAERKAVALGLKFNVNEWQKKVPQIKYDPNDAKVSSRHAVTATDFFLYNGKKALLIDDSWGIDSGFQGRRILTEDWFSSKRVTSSWCFHALKNTWQEKERQKKPKHHFDNRLAKGMWTKEIEILQEILQYEELFPVNVVTSGYYGTITSEAVHEFQYLNNIGTQKEREALQGKVVGPKTRAVLNKKYG